MTDYSSSLRSFDETAAETAKKRWDSIAKPLESLGYLEDAVIKIAGIRGLADVRLDKKAVIVCCADNGVVLEGVTQCGPEISAVMAGNIADGRASVNLMAKVAGADVFSVDMGLLRRVPGTIDMHIADGTQNIAKGPAMSEEQAEKAIKSGIELVHMCAERGYDIIATGEMGIGNTTTSTAILSALFDIDAEELTGRGAGLSDRGLKRKIEVIREAVNINKPYTSGLDVLRKLGGFDIAGLTGVFIGGAVYGIPVLIDGIISSVAAFTAAMICPGCTKFMLATHMSAEPAAELVLARLGLKPLIRANMRLGEGTGAVCAMPLLDMALAVYRGEAFEDFGIDAYEHQDK